MNNEFQLNAIGQVKKNGGGLTVTVEKEQRPAMKYLSLFSHATLLFGDGEGALLARVARLARVCEKTGLLELEASCGLLEGNVLYDIKPYMPCEDRITESTAPPGALPDRAAAPGGRPKAALASGGLIRREQGRYFLHPDDFEGFLATVEGCSHVKVLWWFSRFDKPEYRRATQGDPPYENAPRSGIFATRSPVRPNPIALTVGKILHIDREAGCAEVSELDCFDGSPLIAVKPYLASADKVDGATAPQWLAHWPDHKETDAPAFDRELLLDDSPAVLPEEEADPLSPADAAAFFDSPAAAAAGPDSIVVRGARQNNLRRLDVEIPKGMITAVAGVSGSGKSSLAFDTLYAESRRRLSETADGMEKPDVDSIAGLPPAVAVAQRAIGRNPRSTVGTFTGIQDRLRLLYAAIGRRHCPQCAKPVTPKSRGELTELLRGLAGRTVEIRPHGAQVWSPAGGGFDWAGTVDSALREGKGAFYLRVDGGQEILAQTRQMCYRCGHILFEMSPALFSFNNPESMCPVCSGLGVMTDIDPELVVARPELSLLDGASGYWGDLRAFARNPTANWMRGELMALAADRGVDLETPWLELPESFRSTALYGSGGEEVTWNYTHPKNGRSGTITRPVEGAVPVLNRLMKKGGGAAARIAEQFVRPMACTACRGERLAREGRMVTVGGLRYPQAASMTIRELNDWLRELPGRLPRRQMEAAGSILLDIHARAKRLLDVGLPYLGLDRAVPTLSGGEVQRLKLVAQMGLGLSGLLVVLDEPTAGLHPRDYPSILGALRSLKEEGNTVLVVEHEEAILKEADHLIEIGPGAGRDGGGIIWQGSPPAIAQADTQTGLFLSGRRRIAAAKAALPPPQSWVRIAGARGNNLRDIDVTFPRGRITCITGVSGSGKSTLAAKVIAPAMGNLAANGHPGPCCRSVSGAEGIGGVVHASQASIGYSSRSNIATYLKLMDEIRPLFAATPQAGAAGLTAASFSFNGREGQCDACKGEGRTTIAVPYAADIHTVCPVCAGKRYKRGVLEVLYRGKSIADIMELSVEEALGFFGDSGKIVPALRTLDQVGLGYLKLGQGTGTLSGGEAQRVKLAKALTEKRSGQVLYLLDEPTAGLHFSDIQNLATLLSRLAADGHTVLIIEHNRQLIRIADWIIDLGPEGGDGGGLVVVQGTPEAVAACADSRTGAALRLS